MNTFRKILIQLPILWLLGLTNVHAVNHGDPQKDFICLLDIEFTSQFKGNTGCCTHDFIAKFRGSRDSIMIDWGDGSPVTLLKPANASNSYTWTHSFCGGSIFVVSLYAYYQCGVLIGTATYTLPIVNPCPPPTPCYDCISSFAPIPGKKYLISGWVKEENAAQSKTNYTYPNLQILYPSISGGAGPFFPTGNIIDGWQRVEGEFIIPGSAVDIKIQLNCATGNCYFDDIRVLPFDGSLKSYVYDPVTLKLSAELDERNYATLYEYDDDGQLIRVKKETEKGKMTIKENRNNTKK